MDDNSTIDPPGVMCRSACWPKSMHARTLTACSRSHASAFCRSSGRPVATPTTITRPSSPPIRSLAAWTTRGIASASATSATSAYAVPPASRTSSQVVARAAGLTSTQVSVAPSCAKSIEIARPLPTGGCGSSISRCPAPTTRTLRPARRPAEGRSCPSASEKSWAPGSMAVGMGDVSCGRDAVAALAGLLSNVFMLAIWKRFRHGDYP